MLGAGGAATSGDGALGVEHRVRAEKHRHRCEQASVVDAVRVVGALEPFHVEAEVVRTANRGDEPTCRRPWPRRSRCACPLREVDREVEIFVHEVFAIVVHGVAHR